MSISLRDQFAIAALQGLVANPQNWMVESEVLASAAYKHADEMLAERDKNASRLYRIRMSAQNMVNHPKGISVEKSGEMILGLLDGYGVGS